jgi:hypothetical protein
MRGGPLFLWTLCVIALNEINKEITLMKIRFYILAVVISFATTLNPSFAQWVQTNGPYGNQVNCFATSGTDIYAGTGGGVFLSTNNGTSWADISAGLNGFEVSSLAIDSNGTGGINLIAVAFDPSTGWGGIFLSTNRGASWTEVADSLHTPVGAQGVRQSLIVTPNGTGGTNVFYGGTFTNGLLHSTDNGASWKIDSMFYPSSGVYPLASCPNETGGANIFVSYGGVIYLSTDDGMTWNTAADSGLIYVVASLAAYPDGKGGTNLFAGTYAGGVFLSTNNGGSWQAINSGLLPIQVSFDVTILAASPNGTGGMNIFAGTNTRGIFLSTNNGTSWNAVNSELTDTSVLALAVNPNGAGGTNIFAGTSNGGVFLSTNNGMNWSAVNSGLAADVHVLAASPRGTNGTKIFAGTGGGISISTDNGDNWTSGNTGWPNYSITALASSGSNIFAGTSYGIFVSTDDGNSWGVRDTGIVTSPINTFAVNGTDIFAAGGFYTNAIQNGGHISIQYHLGMYISSDNGMNWTMIDSGLAGPQSQVTSLAIDSSVAGTRILYATTMHTYGEYPDSSSGIYRSTNNGTIWSHINTLGIPMNAAYSLGIVSDGKGGTNLIAPFFAWTHIVYGHYVCGGNISTDGGATWNAVTISPEISIVNSFAVKGTNIFAGTNRGVFVSTNSGLNWTDVNSGLVNLNVQSLAIGGGYLFAGTGGGVWRRPLSDFPLGVEDNYGHLPSAFRLFQNYPNPFNPSTTISYQLSVVSRVSLKVYDVLGREVETLVNERQTAGTHAVKFNATNLPSGVYFCRLQAGTYHETKKLLLLK